MSSFESAERNESRTMFKNSNTLLARGRSGSTSTGMLLLSILFGGLSLAGCASGTSTSTPATASGTVYTYQGVSNLTPADAGGEYVPFWTFILEDAENSFSYDPAINNSNNLPLITSGTSSADNGYLALTTVGQPTAAQGYALTIPGEAALLRPGDSTTPPVITAGMSSCPIVSSSETFLFVALPGAFWNPATSAAYGSIQAGTDATGTAWSFSNQSQSLFAGSGTPPVYPASFTGTCGQGINGYSIGVLPTYTWPTYEPQLSVSPSGFFTETTTGAVVGDIGIKVQQPFIGVVAPSSALDTTSLAAGKYLGFVYESLLSTAPNQNATTQLVSFGSGAAGSGTSMTGGVFPNDDPSQTPASNITVNFGTQSAGQNGLYTGVTVTIPDTNTSRAGLANCANGGGTSGTAPNGSPTCTFPAVAIAGNPQSKFAIFLIGQDPSQEAPFGLYLYQQ